IAVRGSAFIGATGKAIGEIVGRGRYGSIWHCDACEVPVEVIGKMGYQSNGVRDGSYLTTRVIGVLGNSTIRRRRADWVTVSIVGRRAGADPRGLLARCPACRVVRGRDVDTAWQFDERRLAERVQGPRKTGATGGYQVRGPTLGVVGCLN